MEPTAYGERYTSLVAFEQCVSKAASLLNSLTV